MKTTSSPSISARISITRVFCIFFLVFVHVNPWERQIDMAQYGIQVFDVARLYFIELLSRGSVPLLSLISGYLLIGTLEKSGFIGALKKKTGSLLLPLVAWNVIAIATRTALATLSGGHAEFDIANASVLDWFNAVASLTASPALTPLYFLRDVFVCCLLSPLLIRLTRWNLPATVALTLAVFWTNLDGLLILSDTIPTFFVLGFGWRMGKLSPEFGLRHKLPFIVAALAFPAVIVVIRLIQLQGYPLTGIPDYDRLLINAVILLQRFFGIFAFWIVVTALASSPVAAVMKRFESSVFLAFCAHPLILGVLWKLWEPRFGGYYGTLYPLFFFSMPLVVFLIARVGVVGVNILPGWIADALCGGRASAKPRRREDIPTVTITSPSTEEVGVGAGGRDG